MGTSEPKHIDESGVERPGSQPLNSVITSTRISKADDAWTEHYKDAHNQSAESSQNPHISENYSPLESLITDAFERFGNMDATSIDANIKRILLKYSNKIVEDVRIHPYASMPNLSYYKSLQDTRPIPDEIMISGLTYHYAKWNDSLKAKTFYAEYVQTLNQILYQRKYGSGKLELTTVDKPTSQSTKDPGVPL